jgi:hypothetical protein
MITSLIISKMSYNRFYAKLPVWLKRFLLIILVLQEIIHIKVNLRKSKTLDDVLKFAFNLNFFLD